MTRCLYTACRIETRSKLESDLSRVDALGPQPRDLDEGAYADTGVLCHLLQSHLHDFSVLADERHKIGDRAECRDVQMLCKELLSLHLPKCLNEL